MMSLLSGFEGIISQMADFSSFVGFSLNVFKMSSQKYIRFCDPDNNRYCCSYPFLIF